MRRCENCKCVSPDSAVVCVHCGASLAGDGSQMDGSSTGGQVPAGETDGDDGGVRGTRMPLLAVPFEEPGGDSRPLGTPVVHMSFVQILRTCLVEKYFMLEGRASRREYWLFCYFVFLVLTGSFVVSMMAIMTIFTNMHYDTDLFFTVGCLEAVLCLLFLLPVLSATVRRLHDTGHSGRYVWLALVPVVGLVMLLACLAADSEQRRNRYGSYVIVTR